MGQYAWDLGVRSEGARVTEGFIQEIASRVRVEIKLDWEKLK